MDMLKMVGASPGHNDANPLMGAADGSVTHTLALRGRCEGWRPVMGRKA